MIANGREEIIVNIVNMLIYLYIFIYLSISSIVSKLIAPTQINKIFFLLTVVNPNPNPHKGQTLHQWRFGMLAIMNLSLVGRELGAGAFSGLAVHSDTFPLLLSIHGGQKYV